MKPRNAEKIKTVMHAMQWMITNIVCVCVFFSLSLSLILNQKNYVKNIFHTGWVNKF